MSSRNVSHSNCNWWIVSLDFFWSCSSNKIRCPCWSDKSFKLVFSCCKNFSCSSVWRCTCDNWLYRSCSSFICSSNCFSCCSTSSRNVSHSNCNWRIVFWFRFSSTLKRDISSCNWFFSSIHSRSLILNSSLVWRKCDTSSCNVVHCNCNRPILSCWSFGCWRFDISLRKRSISSSNCCSFESNSRIRSSLILCNCVISSRNDSHCICNNSSVLVSSCRWPCDCCCSRRDISCRNSSTSSCSWRSVASDSRICSSWRLCSCTTSSCNDSHCICNTRKSCALVLSSVTIASGVSVCVGGNNGRSLWLWRRRSFNSCCNCSMTDSCSCNCCGTSECSLSCCSHSCMDCRNDIHSCCKSWMVVPCACVNAS